MREKREVPQTPLSKRGGYSKSVREKNQTAEDRSKKKAAIVAAHQKTSRKRIGEEKEEKPSGNPVQR